MEKKEEKIIELVKKGYSFNKIANELGEDYKELLKIKQDMMKSGKLTEEDIKNGKKADKISNLKENKVVQKIFEYKRQGLSSIEIESKPEINVSKSTINNYVNEGIKYNLITQEEIDKVRHERERKRRIEDPVTVEILKGLKNGETYKSISRRVPMTDCQIKNVTVWLIEEKVITQEEIDSAKINPKKKPKPKENNTEVLEEQQIIDYLTLGYDNYDIRYRHPKLNNEVFLNMLDKILEERKITKEEIKQYRQEKREKDKIEILKMLKKGISKKDIAKKLSITEMKMVPYIREIKEEQNINDDDIQKWKDKLETSMKNKRKAVFEALKLGLSVQETIDRYPEQHFEKYSVIEIRKNFIKEGKISKEKIKEYKKIKEKNKNSHNNLTELENEVFKYLKQGLNINEIVEKTGKSKSYMFEIIDKIRKKGKITNQQIKQYRAIRKKLQNENITLKSKEKRKTKNNEKIEKDFSKNELETLEKKMKNAEISYKDIVNYSKLCIMSGQHGKALSMIRNLENYKIKSLSEENLENLSKIKKYLENVEKVNESVQIIKNGNSNAEVINEVTGLPEEYINILKIRLTKRKAHLLNINNREKIISLLLQFKNLKELYKKLKMSDLEIQDIENQALYRNKKLHSKKQSFEVETKQDSLTRIIVLYTKLGEDKQNISNLLEIQEQEIEDILNKALKAGMIKENELQGINILDFNMGNEQLDFKEK